MSQKVTVKSLFEEFKNNAESEGNIKLSNSAMSRIEEGFYAGAGLLLKALDERISELPEEEGAIVLARFEDEVFNFFLAKKESDKNPEIIKIGEGVLEKGLPEFLIGISEPKTPEDEGKKSFSVIMKTDKGFDILAAESSKDRDLLDLKISVIADVFNAEIVAMELT